MQRRQRIHIARLLQATILVVAWFCGHACLANEASGTSLAQGQLQCDRGSFSLAVETLGEVYRQHPTGAEHVKAAGALGLAYLQMRQPLLAERYLREAYAAAGEPLEKARYGLDLANLEANQRHVAMAEQLYDEVLRLAPADPGIQLSAALNRIPLAPRTERLALLEQVQLRISELPEARDRAAFSLNLGTQAKAIGDEPEARRLAYAAFANALSAARPAGHARLMAAAQNQLAQLYEDRHRTDESLLLTTQGIVSAQAHDARDLLIALEWRRGRLLALQGKLGPAIGAYQRAVDQIEAVRQDIPVEYDNGRSSFRDTLEPVYLGLSDLLLLQTGQLDAAAQAQQLLRVRKTLELIKQTELEDFLGNRCAVEGSGRTPQPGAATSSIARGTAVLYPVILADRLELLIETSAGIERKTVAITAETLRRDAAALAVALRTRRPFLDLSRRLYDAVMLPAADVFERETINTVVVVPDGALRLVPFGALHDGQHFAIEKFAIIVVPAVTLPENSASATERRRVHLLLAGVSEPGTVVEKLPAAITAQLLGSGGDGPASAISGARAMFDPGLTRNVVATETPAETPEVAPGGQPSGAGPSTSEKGARDRQLQNRTLQNKLALSGVVEEISAIAKLAPSTILLNQGFSVQAFSDQVRSGQYSVVHIASHGVFGATADATFLMAHDDLITIDQLQSYLRGPSLRNRPIELLTLSACETAEGDDRAPLGLSGAALKAQAQSALGSLWPVSDNAAKILMTDFYRNLVGAGVRGTAKALQDAQVRMIGQPGLQHPYFWAPFILVERRL